MRARCLEARYSCYDQNTNTIKFGVEGLTASDFKNLMTSYDDNEKRPSSFKFQRGILMQVDQSPFSKQSLTSEDLEAHPGAPIKILLTKTKTKVFVLNTELAHRASVLRMGLSLLSLLTALVWLLGSLFLIRFHCETLPRRQSESERTP